MPTWNVSAAKHLLSRCLFGYTKADLAKAMTYSSAAEFVDNELLAELPMPTAPWAWVDEKPVDDNGTIDGYRYRGFNYWWFERMLHEGTNMREKMVLFWHNHFTTQRSDVNFPQQMWHQQVLFRKYAWGDLRQLCKDISIDPAMLRYLNGNGSKSRNATPNENYAREVMELFTLGVGNYTEADIKDAAKCFAGWRVDGVKANFDPNRVSAENKTILGKTGKFTYDQVIDILFEQAACAPFICRKIFKEFVGNSIDDAFVLQMAKVLKESNYNIKPVLSFLLKSELFYDAKYRAVKIKNPMELMIGNMKMFDFKNLNIKYDDTPNSDYAYIYDTSKILQQQLFEPPNVAGWPGQRDWISSTTFAYRSGFTDSFVNGRRPNGAKIPALTLKALDYARSFVSAEQADAFVAEIANTYMQYPLSKSKIDKLVTTLLDGTILNNYGTYIPMADSRIQKFIKAFMRLPEFQLC
jgi:hypothetical protein